MRRKAFTLALGTSAVVLCRNCVRRGRQSLFSALRGDFLWKRNSGRGELSGLEERTQGSALRFPRRREASGSSPARRSAGAVRQSYATGAAECAVFDGPRSAEGSTGLRSHAARQCAARWKTRAPAPLPNFVLPSISMPGINTPSSDWRRPLENGGPHCPVPCRFRLPIPAKFTSHPGLTGPLSITAGTFAACSPN